MGVLFFALSVFIGKEKNDDLKAKVEDQQKEIIKLQIDNSQKTGQIKSLIEKIDLCNKRVDTLFKISTLHNKQ